ncbi:FapA family protein [Jeotgalibacillus alimentarius]|nr:FapA family protein [Jeotgalibacillus alimentarius]
MESIISKGRTIHEAVQTGIDILKVPKETVHIEILQAPSKGFLKIGTKQAVVKLIMMHKDDDSAGAEKIGLIAEMNSRESESHFAKRSDTQSVALIDNDGLEESATILEHSSIKTEMLDKYGSVSVENGQLIVKSGSQKLPAVIIPEEMMLYCNQLPVNEKTVVLSPEDTFSLDIQNECKKTEWCISIDQDKLNAYLEIEPGYEITRRISDMAPASELTLLFTEKKITQLSLSESEVKEEMKEKSILQNLVQDELIKALNSEVPGKYRIAAGTAPINGKDGWLEVKVETSIKEKLKEDEHGKIDFRDTKVFPNVESGDVIGIIHPSEEGIAGSSVFGETIHPKPVYPIILRLGKGVEQIDDKVIATENGRPQIEQRGQLYKMAVVPKLVHNGDISLESGNISFFGDIDITGEVHHGMKIEAQGNIIIGKNISGSHCHSTGAISVKGNVISSDLSAGQNNLTTSKLSILVGVLKQDIDQIITAISQLLQSPDFKKTDLTERGLQPLLRILIENKFSDLIPRMKKYVKLVKEGRVQLHDSRWEETADQISDIFLTVSGKSISMQNITLLSHQLASLQEELNVSDETLSTIRVQNVMNSRIHAGGNLSITGRSCIQSRIHSGGYMTITGAMRGGEAYAEKGMNISEAGAASGTTTILAVPQYAVINIGVAFEGTVLRIGNRKKILSKRYEKVVARIDKRGDIILQ